MIEAVHSGFQCGSDQAGVITAHALGLRTGGWIPKGWKTEAGPAPWAKDYGIREHPSAEYPPRTALNIQETDGTVIFGRLTERGSQLTLQICKRQQKPTLHFDVPFIHRGAAGYMKEWIEREQIKVLNCAGNRESVNPGIFQAVSEFLLEVLSRQ